MAGDTGWLLRAALRAMGQGRVWLGRWLLLLALVLAAMGWLARRGRALTAEEVDAFELEAARFRRRPGQRLVHLAGRERAGKSAVGNALLGTDFFGPGADPDQAAELRLNWWLRELPAAAVRLSAAEHLDAHLRTGDIVVLVVDEQLFGNDRRWLQMLRDDYPDIHPLVAINKADLLARQYTAAEIDTLQAAVRAEATDLLTSSADLVWCAAGATPPDVAELRGRLEELMG